MAARKGLGKGIDVLIPEKKEKKSVVIEEKEAKNKEYVKININKIEPNELQPRKDFGEDALMELAESIKQHGLIEPLIVQKKENDFYEIIAGERRWRAARLAELNEIPVIIREYSHQEAVEIALIENIQREDLNAIEEANAYQRLIDEFDLKQDEVAERVSKSRVAITNSLRLLKLDERVQQMLIEENIKGGHARALLPLEKEEQYKVAQKVFDEKLSVRETEKLVKQILNKEENKKKKEPVVFNNELVYKKFEENIENIMGTKVVINRKTNEKGRIEIDYYSEEEFERISNMLLNIKKD